MDPVTHLLTGACLARTGCNRKAAYATLAMTLAAEAPDLDTLWAIRGPIAAFQHHRGWTHTLVGIPFEAVMITVLICLLHRWRKKPIKTQVNWRLLWLFCLLALASHLLLDWTNNYGLRPFFPFNPRWYAGGFVVIVDPVILTLLAAALILPALFGLISNEIGAAQSPFRGRASAIVALAAIAVIWGFRADQRSRAIDLAATAIPEARRIFASPEPLNPFRWHLVLDLPNAFQLAAADTRAGTLTATPDDLLYKPPTTLATLHAKRGALGEAYLDWASYPLVTDIGPDGDGFTEVTFTDARFLYDTLLLRGREHPPLGGIVYLNPENRIDHSEMNGRADR